MTGKGPFTWRLIGFLALALGLLAWTLSALGAFSYARGIHVSATFADASGLLVGSQVLVSGVPVGKVTSISLDERQQARVEMVIDEKVAISRDVEAVLRARSLLGEKVIALGPAPATDGQTRLAAGDEIASARVEADMLMLAARAGSAMESLGGAASGLDELLATLREVRDEIASGDVLADLHAVGDLARRADGLIRSHESGVEELLASARRGADALAEASGRAVAPLERLDRVLADLEQGDAAGELTALAREARAAIVDSAGQVEASARALGRLLGDGDDATAGDLAEDLGAAGRSAREFFTQAASLVDELERMAGSLDRSLGKLDIVLENASHIDLREIRRILQDEGVKVLLLD